MVASVSLDWWKTFFEIGGVGLLFLTFVFGAGVVWTSTRINEIQAERLRNFDKELTGAKTELATQQQRAANAERGVADAKKDAADALKDAGIANQHAGEANARAQAESIERLKLQAEIQPRELSLAQQNEIGIALHRRFAGSHVSVRSYTLDAEGWRLGQQIIAALRGGGIQVLDATNNFMQYGGSLLTGVRVSGPEQTRELVEALTSALRSQGSLVVLPPVSGQPLENVSAEVMVGVKPFATAQHPGTNNAQ